MIGTITTALIVIALITFGVTTDSGDFKVAAFLFAYFAAAHGLVPCIGAWAQGRERGGNTAGGNHDERRSSKREMEAVHTKRKRGATHRMF